MQYLNKITACSIVLTTRDDRYRNQLLNHAKGSLVIWANIICIFIVSSNWTTLVRPQLSNDRNVSICTADWWSFWLSIYPWNLSFPTSQRKPRTNMFVGPESNQLWSASATLPVRAQQRSAKFLFPVSIMSKRPHVHPPASFSLPASNTYAT